jgi:hypothetical protein
MQPSVHASGAMALSRLPANLSSLTKPIEPLLGGMLVQRAIRVDTSICLQFHFGPQLDDLMWRNQEIVRSTYRVACHECVNSLLPPW